MYMEKYIVEPFLCRDIIIEKSENIEIYMMEPIFEKTIIESNVYDNPDISIFEYANILLVQGEYKLYYRGLKNYSYSWNLIRAQTEQSTPFECLCLLTSKDGLNFEKINANLHEYKNNKANNIIKDYSFCHNFFPYYNAIKEKYLALSGTGMFNNGLFLFNSNDGINWDDGKKIIDPSRLLSGWCHPNHFDSHNSIIYNENECKYYLFVRN